MDAPRSRRRARDVGVDVAMLPADMLRAVHAVAGGAAMLSPSVTRSLIASVAGDGGTRRRVEARRRLAQLSERAVD